MRSRSASKITYTLSGALRTVSVGGLLRATYVYNHLEQRTRKTLAAPPPGTPATTLYRYDTQGHLVEELAGSAASASGISVTAGQTLVTYVWKDDSPSAIIYAPNSPANPGNALERIVYLHTDHLGTPRKATDQAARVVWSWESDAFGSSAPNEDPDGDGSRTTINLRFPGQYFDQESGLHYNWHRYYDALTGRYIQSDPIGLTGGISTYLYANASPLMHSDPSGQAAAAVTCFVPGVGWVSCAVVAGSAVIAGGTWWLINKGIEMCREGMDENERCKLVLKQCREKCQGTWERGEPPFSGSDAAGRMRRCIRECMEAAGCFNF